MTVERRVEIEALVEATTRTQWIDEELSNGVWSQTEQTYVALDVPSRYDRAFIAAAPDIVRELLAEIDRKDAVLQRIVRIANQRADELEPDYCATIVRGFAVNAWQGINPE